MVLVRSQWSCLTRTLHGAAQITAAVRCKRSKWVFLVGTLFGYEWKERDLFHPMDQVRHGGQLCTALEAGHVGNARVLDPRARVLRFIDPPCAWSCILISCGSLKLLAALNLY